MAAWERRFHATHAAAARLLIPPAEVRNAMRAIVPKRLQIGTQIS